MQSLPLLTAAIATLSFRVVGDSDQKRVLILFSGTTAVLIGPTTAILEVVVPRLRWVSLAISFQTRASARIRTAPTLDSFMPALLLATRHCGPLVTPCCLA